MREGIGLRHFRFLFDSVGHESSTTIHQVTIGGKKDVDALIYAPDTINDEVAIFHANSNLYPYGITLVSVQITLPDDAAYSMVFEEWSGDPPAAVNDITTVTTTGSEAFKQVLAADMADSSIAANAYIFLHIPSTVVDWVHVKIIFTRNSSYSS